MNSCILFCRLIYFLCCFPPPENRFHNSLKDRHLLSYLLLCKNPPQNSVVKTMISCFSCFGGLAVWVVLLLVFPGTTYEMAVTWQLSWGWEVRDGLSQVPGSWCWLSAGRPGFSFMWRLSHSRSFFTAVQCQVPRLQDRKQQGIVRANTVMLRIPNIMFRMHAMGLPWRSSD